MDIFTLKKAIIEASDVSVLGVMKQLYPAFDEVKFEEAVRIAGSERWLKYHIKKGNITKIRRGTAKNSPIFYSRREIAAVKMAEAELAKFK
ncbi:hypothetical protein [Dysgonomonas gadei]|uniref:Uncharacterized protein n=1 Tax=Dysgonomonas gadei ATCC BAA-286 TaxID=742766 RepID=F5J199_9BACT|nr:hypothetical protein [Dysgonomonas gadei]EGK00473.1 hypothetical protein HMPREF9455_03116 [Dysgonomonas gadei ATCC BAA-286]